MSVRFALVGDPVVGSASPAMHRAAFAELGLDADYEAVTVPAGGLAARFPELRERFAGLNVTAPLKEEALGLLDRMGPEVTRAGSVNTLAFTDRGVLGRSTDGEGFVAALRGAGHAHPGRAVVVGTGGAASAVAAALADGGTAVTVAGRDREAGRRLAARLDVRFVPLDDAEGVGSAVAGAGLLANATPTDLSGLPGLPLRPGLVVFDLVYRPRRTPLLRRAREAGCATVEGVEMLIEQGARSFSIWTGLPAPVRAMRTAALAALDPLAVGDH